MVTNYDKYKAAGAEILAITVDPPEKNLKLAKKLSIKFPVLADIGHKVIDTYDILDPGGKISRAAVFIIDKKGIVHWVYVADNYRVRPTDETLLTELGKIK